MASRQISRARCERERPELRSGHVPKISWQRGGGHPLYKGIFLELYQLCSILSSILDLFYLPLIFIFCLVLMFDVVVAVGASVAHISVCLFRGV